MRENLAPNKIMEEFGIKTKQLISEEIKQRLKDSPCLFLTSLKAVPVSEQGELRRRLKEIDASLFVVKNRIASRVMQKLNLKALAELMQGTTAIAAGGNDSIALSKALVDFGKKNENFKILGGYTEEQLLDPNSVKRLAAIPSREVLLAQIVCGINSPIHGLVNTLSATIKKFLIVLGKIQEKK